MSTMYEKGKDNLGPELRIREVDSASEGIQFWWASARSKLYYIRQHPKQMEGGQIRSFITWGKVTVKNGYGVGEMDWQLGVCTVLAEDWSSVISKTGNS